MIKIRLTLKDGRIFYANEGWAYNHKAIELKPSITEGLDYHSIVEFKVAWKIYHHHEHNGVTIDNPDYDYRKGSWTKYIRIKPESVVRFEAIDTITLKKKSFDVNKMESLPKSKVLKFPPQQFNMLKKHPYTSCHWTYIGKQWKAFPTDKDYKLIDSIRYYRRGLTGLIWDAFCYRNTGDIHFMNYFYLHRKELLFNSIILKMYLRDDIDSCETFILKPIAVSV